MKQFVLGTLLGLVIGAAVGYAGGIFHFPYLFPPPAVNEVVVGKLPMDVVARGAFIHADPSDAVHHGRGSLTVYEDLVHLESDFEVGPGPKYHVYLVPEADVAADADLEAMPFVDLGRLKAFTGSQSYPVPSGVNVLDFGSVVIWCEQFKVVISPARIEPSRSEHVNFRAAPG